MSSGRRYRGGQERRTREDRHRTQEKETTSAKSSSRVPWTCSLRKFNCGFCKTKKSSALDHTLFRALVASDTLAELFVVLVWLENHAIVAISLHVLRGIAKDLEDKVPRLIT